MTFHVSFSEPPQYPHGSAGISSVASMDKSYDDNLSNGYWERIISGMAFRFENCIRQQVPSFYNSTDLRKWELASGIRDKVRCRAKNQLGRECGRWADHWHLVCKVHGAATYRAMEAAERRQFAAHYEWDQMTPDQRVEHGPWWPVDQPRTKQNYKRAAAARAEREDAPKRWAEAEAASLVGQRLPSLSLAATHIERRRYMGI